MKKNIIIPKTLWGQKIAKLTKKERIIKYLLESFVFSLLLTILQMLVFYWKGLLEIINFVSNKNYKILITFIMLMIFNIIFTCILNYLYSEYQIKLSKKKLESSI